MAHGRRYGYIPSSKFSDNSVTNGTGLSVETVLVNRPCSVISHYEKLQSPLISLYCEANPILKYHS